MIAALENDTEDTVQIPIKHHKHFVARRGEVLEIVAEEFGGVQVSRKRKILASSRNRLVLIHRIGPLAKPHFSTFFDDSTSLILGELPEKRERIRYRHHQGC